MASPQADGTERLSAWIEENRIVGANADQQDVQQRLFKELLSIQERWSSLTAPSRTSASGSLFPLLLQALLVYSGNHTGSATSGVGSSMTIPLISSSVETSESVLNLFCELLAKAYDYAAVPVLNDYLSNKSASVYVKTALIMVVARLSPQDASQFITEAVAFANRNVRAADYYMKQCLVESVARLLYSSGSNNNSVRLTACHADALKIVTKTFQDKLPEVRIAAAGLLHVIAMKTSTITSTTSSTHASSAASGSASNGASANGSGAAGSASGAANGGTGSGSGAGGGSGVTLEAVMQTAYKGMDDAAPEARRAFSVVVGIVLAKFVSFGAYDVHHGDGHSHSHSHAQHTDGSNSPNGVEASSEGGGSGSGSASKSKSLGFKLAGMHVPGLSRRKGGTASADFSSIANVVLYLKDLVGTKFLASVPSHGQHHGGILASYAVALCSMFERLPTDLIADSQLDAIVQAILSILDHQLTLPDLTRARNAVCFALRYGVNLALTERQQGALLGVYVQIAGADVESETMNHHKVLAVLVEMSHLVQAIGEASVVHADDAIQVLHVLLIHEKQSVRFQAAVAMASLLTALPYKLKSCMLDCLASLRETSSQLLKDNFDRLDSGDEGTPSKVIKGKAQLYAVQGYSTAISHIVRAFVLQQKASGVGGLSHRMLSSIMNLAERLVESQFIDGCTDSIWLTCTRAGWNLVGSLVTVKEEHWIHGWMRKLADMWLRSSILHSRETSLELLRVEAAVVAMHSFLHSCRDAIVKSQSLQMLMAHVLHAYLIATRGQLAKPQKRRGQIARHRLISWIMKCFTVLPPVYSDSYITLLEMVTEFTTAQSLTSLNHSPLHPATSTFLCNALSGADDPLDMVSTSRLVAGDDPSALFSRELNHILALLQPENALSDTEVEVQYLDNFWGLLCESFGGTKNDVYDRAMSSSFTYVRLVDASVFLFGKMFHHLPEDLQLRCLQHFAGVLTDGRLDCEVNVCALVFAVIRQAKSSLGTATLSSAQSLSWPTQVQSMLYEMISSDNSTIRRGAGESLGLLASIIADESAKALVHELEKRLIAAEKLPTGTSIHGSNGAPIDSSVLAAGASFALACVKRSCGSGIYVDPGLIFRFAGEIAQPLRTWILHSWSIIVDSVSASGGDYEQYVKSSTSLIEAHLVAGFRYSNKTNKKWLRWDISARVAIGRIINGVVATLGPELATSLELLAEYYTLWALLRQDGYDSRVELEYLKFVEQVVVFAPARFDASDLLYILNIVSDAFGSATPTTTNDATSPPAMADSSSAPVQSPPSQFVDPLSFGSMATQRSTLRNEFVPVNGLSRNILQQVGMSCLRTLAERDPSVIRRYNLQCLLFHALHVEYNTLSWRYMPGLHGMWDLLTFKFFIPCKSRDGLAEIQHTILALIDIDGGNWGSCQPCVWALFCRGVAIGESSSAASSNENLMMSPKGIELLAIPGLGDPKEHDGTRWGSAASQSRNTGTHVTTGAATAQVDTWRRTKRHVRQLLSLIPVLSRQVRRFAVECVVRVFDLVGRGAEVDIKPHFDLVEARARFLASVSVSVVEDVASPSSASELSGLNFLSMYVDEFVTLACHATTLSADGKELPIFQCEGLRLLKVVLAKFASARDPEVADDSAFLLDPYQAQISSAVRHAVKQVQPPSDGSGDDDQDFYAPLALEAFCLCGESVRCRLVQDKVALGRILRMVVTKDYGHAHQFAGDEVTRVAVSLANLACIANLVVTSLTAGDAASALAKALTSTISVAAMDHVVACWLDATACYGLLMQGFGVWPVALLPVSHEHKVILSSVLKISIPVALPQLSPSHAQGPSPTVDALRDVFKRYWPAFPHAVMALLDANAVSPNAVAGKLDVLLSYCVFHLVTGVRDRQDTDIVPVLKAIPRLLRALSRFPSWSEFVKTSLAALMFASTHTYAAVRIECLTALFACMTRTADGSNQNAAAFPHDAMALAAQAALSPLQILTQIADPSKHRLSIGGRDDTTIVPELLRFAATGVVFLHTHAAVRASIFDAVPMVDRCVEFFVHHPEHFPSFTAVHRAVVESAIRALKEYGSSEESEYYVEAISNSLALVVELLDATVAGEPVVEYQIEAAQFVYRLTANFAVQVPPSLLHVATAFHGAIATRTLQLIESQAKRRSSDDRRVVVAALVAGVRTVAQKLVDHNDLQNAQRYVGVLGPVSIQIFDSYGKASCVSTADAEELVEMEQWIRLTSTQLNEAQGSAFARLLLPKLAQLLLHTESQSQDVRVSVASTLAKLLLSLAHTRPAAFKEVVGSIAPSNRTVLETTLRSALTGGIGAAQPSGLASRRAVEAGGRSGALSSGFGANALDLSRYK